MILYGSNCTAQKLHMVCTGMELPLLLNPGPCIHYIWSPRTLHSLYPVSPDPAFTISGLPGPCITISGLPGPCIHYIRSPRPL
ncbi:unnamed protein product, partial [Staurois parvus]